MSTDNNTPSNAETTPEDRPPAIRPERQPNHLLRTVIIVAVIGLGIWVWDANKYRILPKRFGVVEQGQIYRSGQIHPVLIEKTLRKHDIQVVVSLLNPDPNDPDQAAEYAAVKKLGIEHKCYPLLGDGTGDLEHYVQALEAIIEAKEQNKPVLVHCAAGSQRTGGTIAFYRLLVQGHDPAQVYREMRRFEWRDKPDHPLLPYLNKNMKTMAERLVELGIIDKVPQPVPQLKSKHQ